MNATAIAPTTDSVDSDSPRRHRGLDAFATLAAMDCYGFGIGYDYYDALYGPDAEEPRPEQPHTEQPAAPRRTVREGLVAAAAGLGRVFGFGAPPQVRP